MQVHLFGNSNSLWDKRWNSPNYLNFGVALIFPESAYVIQIYAFFIDCTCSGIQVTLFVIVNCNCFSRAASNRSRKTDRQSNFHKHGFKYDDAFGSLVVSYFRIGILSKGCCCVRTHVTAYGNAQKNKTPSLDSH
jgi:hypothetical protein